MKICWLYYTYIKWFIILLIFNVQFKGIEKKEKPKEPEGPTDPKECKVRVYKDTTIEYFKDKDKPIGFIIVGGCDTPSVSRNFDNRNFPWLSQKIPFFTLL